MRDLIEALQFLIALKKAQGWDPNDSRTFTHAGLTHGIDQAHKHQAGCQNPNCPGCAGVTSHDQRCRDKGCGGRCREAAHVDQTGALYELPGLVPPFLAKRGFSVRVDHDAKNGEINVNIGHEDNKKGIARTVAYMQSRHNGRGWELPLASRDPLPVDRSTLGPGGGSASHQAKVFQMFAKQHDRAFAGGAGVRYSPEVEKALRAVAEAALVHVVEGRKDHGGWQAIAGHRPWTLHGLEHDPAVQRPLSSMDVLLPWMQRKR